MPSKPFDSGANDRRGKVRTVCAVCHRINWRTSAPLVEFCKHCGHPLVDADEIEHLVNLPPAPPAPRPPRQPTGILTSLRLGREYQEYRTAEADFAADQKRYDDAFRNWREQAFTVREAVVAESIWAAYHKRVPPEDVERMTGTEFEDFLGQLFAKMGYSVRNTPATGDQGGDLILTEPASNRRVVVQAKRSGRPVGNRAVQEVLGAIAYYGCSAGIVITNGDFTAAALSLAAKEKRLEMWNGSKLASAYAASFPTSPVAFDRTAYQQLIERLKRNPGRATARSLNGRWQDQAPTEAQVALLWKKDSDCRPQFRNWRGLFAFAIERHRNGDEAWSRGGLSLRLEQVVCGAATAWEHNKVGMKPRPDLKPVGDSSQSVTDSSVDDRSRVGPTNQPGVAVESAAATDALAVWDQMLAANPVDPQALRGKGIALQVLGRFEEALPLFDAALAAVPTDAVGWHQKARALQVLGRSEEALRALNEALAINPLYTAASTPRV